MNVVGQLLALADGDLDVAAGDRRAGYFTRNSIRARPIFSIPSSAARGFRPSPIYSTMGAAMVSGKLMGMDENGLVATIALAANFASGLNEGPRSGGNELAIHEPQAARNGVYAALMARAGHVKGSEHSIEGEAGFYNAFSGSHTGQLSYAFTGPLQKIDPASITAGLGRDYKLSTAMFRVYPCAGYNQAVIKLMAEMKARHAIDADAVAEVAIYMNWLETLYPSPAFPRFADWQQARIGETKYFAAHAAVNGGYPVVGGQTFGPTGNDLEADTRVLAFMRQHITLVPEKDRPMFSPAIVVSMKDGRKHTGEYPYQRMEWNFDQLVVQLQDCLPGYPAGKSGFEALVALARDLHGLPSVAAIIGAITPG